MSWISSALHGLARGPLGQRAAGERVSAAGDGGGGTSGRQKLGRSGEIEHRFNPQSGIEIVDVHVSFGLRTVLDLSVGPLREQRVAVIGCNGSGKSTLLRLLNGLIECTDGEVFVGGLSVKRNKAYVRRHVGFVFQDPDAQIVMPTVTEEMELGLKALGLGAEEREHRAYESLLRFGLQGREAESPHLLSGGEKQRLALACVYAMDPSILVMDEPSTMLDLPGRLELQRLISELPQRVVVSTHDLELIRGFDRVLVLDGGKLIGDSMDPESAIAAYKHCIASRLVTT